MGCNYLFAPIFNGAIIRADAFDLPVVQLILIGICSIVLLFIIEIIQQKAVQKGRAFTSLDWSVVYILAVSIGTGIYIKGLTDRVSFGIFFGIALAVVLFIVLSVKRSINKGNYRKQKYKNAAAAGRRQYPTDRAGSNGGGYGRAIHAGSTRYDPIVGYISGNRILSPSGEVLYYVDGQTVFSPSGTPAYYINGNDVHAGGSYVGETVYYINGNDIHRGISTVGEIVYHIE